VTEAASTLRATYRCDPYGRRTALLGDAVALDFGYTGHYVHQASGLALAPYRAYDADMGRWLSRDPIEEAGGINLYAYVGNNPINLVDPFGLAPGDKYPSQDEAGFDAVCDVNPLSKDENVEYAGSIYKNADGTYSYTAPKPGGSDWSNPMNSLPEDNSSVTAWYHTHGAYDPNIGPGNFTFSPADRQVSDATRKPNYMADPRDEVHRYDPNPLKRGKGNTKNFKKKCGCAK
jgi:RHS repeat-associated protein